MENELQHTSATPRDFTFHLLERITNKFSKDRIIGYGGYGVVYKGVLDNGEEIAVKKLYLKNPELDDGKQFENECTNLMRAQHQNIVRLVGYCYEIAHKAVEHNRGYVLARVEERALCFEYLQGGSLDKHLSVESCGLGWRTRYNVIRGICEGLHYLHNGSKDPIYHLDLKPANILLDKNMTPKIGDFGLSRLFDSTQTYTTKAIRGTPGYMPPEYIDRYQITKKFDVFSLGVIIIQIMAGREGYSKCVDMPSQEFIDLVHDNWLKTLQATMSSHTAHEVKTCIEIALRCVEADRVKRPTITEIVNELNKIDIAKRSLIDQMPVKMGYGTDGNVPTARHNVIDKETSQNALEVKNETNDSTDATKLKLGKPKIKGVSLTDLFTPEQISVHIDSLRLCVGQSKAKVEKNQLMASSENENSCQLCNVDRLTFEPPLIYCSPCGAWIKRNAPYYTVGTGYTREFFCIPCYCESSGDTIELAGHNVPKARLEKKRNDEETEEWWVQCDKCECWQHQICALFNDRRNDAGQAEYICPYCYIKEVEHGLRMPLPQRAVLGASDLPRTVLSDHIEERLFKRLKLERHARASQTGRSFYEVAGAEGLVVRVVSSVDKKVEVKPRFLEKIQQDNYPTEFPYKSKAVLLFQKIEGVEVCLFKMYVQEFGAECAFPNQRCVYLSSLDSVKYFRPEIKSAYGEALRTFVYHEILIGYLEYCKQRGFTSCYMWACPPLKGEDCILYCHPEIQKTPKSDKLREWYLAMLRKATKEEIVVELTNLYDNFFITMRECKAKVTASRLPYFDGDYWPGAAEDMINQLRQGDDWKLQNKGKTKKFIAKRALKAAGHTDLSGNASNDALLMQKLGETIYPMKEDFIMVHLQYSCRHCCILMSSGKRWVCHQCRSFYICDKCFSTEQQLEERERHPSNSRGMHKLHPVDIVGVPEDTKDKDDILENDFFDNRRAFLFLCQGNHYQYDTLRRAKHSSMMVLYHLHNPTAPAFVTSCNICNHDIEAGQDWVCEVCPDFDVCNGCYQKGAVNHHHKLINHPSAADRDAQNKEARQMRVQQLRKMLDLLVHASTCHSGSCQIPNCRKVKGLYRHGMQCKRRASGGCALCKKMWYMLQLHAEACRDSGCSTPRCRDLKEHHRRLQQQSESRRRAAVNEMMRQ